MKKKLLNIIIITLFMNGCSSKYLNSSAISNSSSSSANHTEIEEPSDGTDKFIAAAGIALIMGVAFALAPKEAYH